MRRLIKPAAFTTLGAVLGALGVIGWWVWGSKEARR